VGHINWVWHQAYSVAYLHYLKLEMTEVMFLVLIIIICKFIPRRRR
jgi:hypothetical protein